MRVVSVASSLCAVLILAFSAGSAKAATLYVNCGGKGGLTSIGAALKTLQYSEDHGPTTINVAGACRENILIQNTDRLTLNALQGASITDASGGLKDLIDINTLADLPCGASR